MEVEAGRRNADDGRLLSIDLDAPANRGRVGTELSRPQLVREHRDRIDVWTVLLLPERTATRRADAQHLEHVRRHEDGVDTLRLIAFAEVDRACAVGSNVGERARLLPV